MSRHSVGAIPVHPPRRLSKVALLSCNRCWDKVRTHPKIAFGTAVTSAWQGASAAVRFEDGPAKSNMPTFAQVATLQSGYDTLPPVLVDGKT
jgi:hypothetical protein